MADGYDFFGTSVVTAPGLVPSAGGHPTTTPFAPLSANGPHPPMRWTRSGWVRLTGVALAIAVAIGGYTYTRQSPPLALPASLVGIPKLAPSAWGGSLSSAMGKARKRLADMGVHHATIGVYSPSASASSALIVFGGTVTATAVNFDQFLQGFSSVLPTFGLTASASAITAGGGGRYQCSTINGGRTSLAFCLLQSSHTFLVGVGGLSDQRTADALDELRTADQLS